MQTCQVCGLGLVAEPHATLVVPVFKSEDHISEVFSFASKIGNVIPAGVSLVFVDDGSPDRSVERIHIESTLNSLPVTVLRLSRNFGSGPAVHAGLGYSQGCATVVFGSDLQEPEELYVEMIKEIIGGKADVCLGQRTSREDPFGMKLASISYWWFSRKFLNGQTPKGGFDVFGLSRSARQSLVNLQELNTSLTSQIQWIGYKQLLIPYERRARLSGTSTWTMRRKMKLFADSVYGFSGTPVALLFVVGLLSTLCFVLLSLVTLFGRLTGLIDVAGYTTLVLLLALGQAVNLLAVGIVGGYLYRTFDNSKGRPKYIISKVEIPSIG